MKNDECLGLPLFAVAAGVRLLREITETECRERSSRVTHLVKNQIIEESLMLYSLEQTSNLLQILNIKVYLFC